MIKCVTGHGGLISITRHYSGSPLNAVRTEINLKEFFLTLIFLKLLFLKRFFFHSNLYHMDPKNSSRSS